MILGIGWWFGRGLLWGLECGMVAGMPVGTTVLDKPTARAIGKSNLDNRLDASQLRREIHQSGICHVVLEMAKTGKRPMLREDEDGTESVVWEEMSEAAHVDVIKFMVRKVLPDAKYIPTVDEKAAHDKWTAIIDADSNGKVD